MSIVARWQWRSLSCVSNMLNLQVGSEDIGRECLGLLEWFVSNFDKFPQWISHVRCYDVIQCVEPTNCYYLRCRCFSSWRVEDDSCICMKCEDVWFSSVAGEFDIWDTKVLMLPISDKETKYTDYLILNKSSAGTKRPPYCFWLVL